MRWNYYKSRQRSLLQSAMDSYYKLRQLFYYKVRHGLLQIATGITKCDGFNANCDRYYKVRCLLQIATVPDFVFLPATGRPSEAPTITSEPLMLRPWKLHTIMYSQHTQHFQLLCITWLTQWRNLTSLWRHVLKFFLDVDIKLKILKSMVSDKIKKLASI